MTTQTDTDFSPVVVAFDQGIYALPAVAQIGYRWNGWLAAPYFDRETVDRLIAEQATLDENHETIVWSEDGRTVLVGEPPIEAKFKDTPLEVYTVEARIIDGVERWPLGSGWTWYEVECSACEQPLTDAPYIVIDEGGDIPRAFVDVRCLDLLPADDRARLVDDAVMREGHNCLDFVDTEYDFAEPVCRVCGTVLEWCGSAIIIPTDEDFTPSDRELTADEVEAIGLDPTGRSGDPRFPYTESDLTVDEARRLTAVRSDALFVVNWTDGVANTWTEVVEGPALDTEARLNALAIKGRESGHFAMAYFEAGISKVARTISAADFFALEWGV